MSMKSIKSRWLIDEKELIALVLDVVQIVRRLE